VGGPTDELSPNLDSSQVAHSAQPGKNASRLQGLSSDCGRGCCAESISITGRVSTLGGCETVRLPRLFVGLCRDVAADPSKQPQHLQHNIGRHFGIWHTEDTQSEAEVGPGQAAAAESPMFSMLLVQGSAPDLRSVRQGPRNAANSSGGGIRRGSPATATQELTCVVVLPPQAPDDSSVGRSCEAARLEKTATWRPTTAITSSRGHPQSQHIPCVIQSGFSLSPPESLCSGT
jgi:hypothetical protein